MSMEYVRTHYGVPARRNARIEFTGNAMNGAMLGTIVGASRQYLRVRMDGEKRIWTLHPTWKVKYLTPNAPGERPGQEARELKP